LGPGWRRTRIAALTIIATLITADADESSRPRVALDDRHTQGRKAEDGLHGPEG
jgi:hypothetical protein